MVNHLPNFKIFVAAYKNAVREQKLPLVLSAAKREKDFYLSKVEKSRALSAIEERMKKVSHIYSGVEGVVILLSKPTAS